jgi:hypothetical protein
VIRSTDETTPEVSELDIRFGSAGRVERASIYR